MQFSFVNHSHYTQVTEIRDVLTVYHEIHGSGKQKQNGIDGLDWDRSRRPERLFGRPDMFLIRTLRARSHEHGFVMTFHRLIALKRL